ncbi:probable low affinity copper uptake protein 2 [Myxocyprinus asiaticus]|uniref:probable low affinity copper uptake protein 2 n=1 Tax=Myxocyprinus asiaticus TaxID=70543 RepID=UPI002222EC8E|nr:probable low affinity copper uptake protein 2 [Myxocyprinus asiaticus]
MNMHFEGSSNVTLLFDFWNVHGPAGMVLSVFVVLLLTVFYELLKVLKITIGKQTQFPITQPSGPVSFSADQACFAPVMGCQGGSSDLAGSPSEISLAPTESTTATTSTAKNWLLHSLQTAIHVLQVTLGYMLMLCVMSYNIWIFLGVIVGSALGYFLAFPLLNHV